MERNSTGKYSGGVGVKEMPPVEQTKSMQVLEFAADEKFAGLRADVKDSAVTFATYFVEASDELVAFRYKTLAKNNWNGSFNHRDKEDPRFKPGKYSELFDLMLEEEKLSAEDAAAFCRKQKRIDTASREARNHFAKLLGYLPGKEGADGERDYKRTIQNPQFIEADTLVREAVEKFS